MILLNFCNKNPDIGQEIMMEWTGEVHEAFSSNSIKNVDINKIRTTSKVHLKWNCCKCGNSYIQAVYRRVKISGCPIFRHNEVVETHRKLRINNENNLYTWCIANPDKGDRVLNEWTGVDENNIVRDINSVTYGSTLVMKWKCVQA